jgi:hypothetical protein
MMVVPEVPENELLHGTIVEHIGIVVGEKFSF